MKDLKYQIIITILFLSLLGGLFWKQSKENQDLGTNPYLFRVGQGGTGWGELQSNTVLLGNGTSKIATTSQGTAGQVLMLSGGTPIWAATSTSGTDTNDWSFTTNYGSRALTASTTIPIWIKDILYASSTSIFQGLATFGNASTTQISASSGSYLGTVFSGTWNGSAIDISSYTNLASTWPVILTGDTLSFGGLSTSTAAVSGNLPYFSGVNTFANIATTSLTATSPLSLSQPISVIGSSASVLSISATGDWTGTIDGNNFAGGAIGAGELIYGGSAGSFSELATSTNGYVLALLGGIPAWVASTTLSTITGTLTTDKGGTGQDSSAWTGFAGIAGGTWSASTSLSANYIQDAFILNTGDIGLGVYDFGGATSFELPNAASPTVNDLGECAIDSTSGQLKCYTDEVEVFVSERFPVFGYSTTTWNGTTTLRIAPAALAQTWESVRCDSNNFIGVSIYDGTNRMNYFEASATIGTVKLTTNNSFTAGEARRVDFGTSTSITSPVSLSCSAIYGIDAD